MPIPASVPAPWTPIQATREGEEIRLDVQGRTYRFGTHAALPTGIRTAGRDILAEPVRLVGRLNGEPITWSAPWLAQLQQSEAGVVLAGALETGGVIISMSVKADYDGVVRFDLALTPFLGFRKGAELTAGLEQLWLEIPLDAACATLFTYWPLVDNTEVKAYEPVNSGAVPADGLTFPFKPFIWLGWEDGGLSWFTESDRHWQPADPARAIEVVPQHGRMVLRLRLLDSLPQAWAAQADGWYHPNPPLTFTFGLQATPVKPMNEDPLSRRIVHLSYYEPLDTVSIEQHPLPDRPGTVLDRVVAAGTQVVVIHEMWNALQNYWVTDRPEEVKAMVAACHARGLKVIPYFGYEVSTLAPEWAELSDRILVKHTDGRYEGGWQRHPPQRDYMVCYASEWQERWLAGIAWMMDAYGFDGVYLDGTTMPWGCANEAHGCGYRHLDGTPGQRYPIFRVREMMRRLYELVTARGGVITAHQSSCCLTPTLQFCHTYWDGEHIDGIKHDAQGAFPLAIVRAEFMGRNFGIPAEFLSGNPQALSYTLLHNVMVRPGMGGMLDTVASIWAVFARFGTGAARWVPYWQPDAPARTETPHVHASAYVRDDSLLLVVANLGQVEAEGLITLADDHARARDAITGDALSLDGRRLAVPCAAMGWRLIEIR